MPEEDPPGCAPGPWCAHYDNWPRLTCDLGRSDSGRPYCVTPLPDAPPPAAACAILRNRTILLLGDSTTRAHADSLRCSLLAGGATETPVDVFNATEITRGDSITRPMRLPTCARYGACGVVCTVRAGTWRGGEPELSVVPRVLLRARLDRRTPFILVANQGLWHIGSAGYGSHTVGRLVELADKFAGAWRSWRRHVQPRASCVLFRYRTGLLPPTISAQSGRLV